MEFKLFLRSLGTGFLTGHTTQGEALRVASSCGDMALFPASGPGVSPFVEPRLSEVFFEIPAGDAGDGNDVGPLVFGPGVGQLVHGPLRWGSVQALSCAAGQRRSWPFIILPFRGSILWEWDRTGTLRRWGP